VVAAHDGEFGLEGGDFFEAEITAVGGIEFGLDVGVGEEDEIEGAGFCCGGSYRMLKRRMPQLPPSRQRSSKSFCDLESSVTSGKTFSTEGF